MSVMDQLFRGQREYATKWLTLEPTMKELTITLSPPDSELDDFLERDANVGKAWVATRDGRQLTGKDAIIQIELSRDAMVGLGVSLIRWAHRLGPKQFSCVELHPMEPEGLYTYLGVNLHPDSCKVVVSRNEFGTVDEVMGNPSKR